MAVVLVVPDLHAPAIHPNALDFVKSIQDYWQTTQTVFLGDNFDFHRLSFHPSEPRSDGAWREHQLSLEALEPWYQHFKKATYLVGNHCSMVARRAVDSGIPEEWLKPKRELFGMPKGWKIIERFGTHRIDGVAYRHGDTPPGGQFPALAHAKLNFESTVLGHYHGAFGVQYFANRQKIIFGCQAGSLCDEQHIVQKYGRSFSKRPILGCAVIIDGEHAICEKMPLPNKK